MYAYDLDKSGKVILVVELILDAVSLIASWIAAWRLGQARSYVAPYILAMLQIVAKWYIHSFIHRAFPF